MCKVYDLWEQAYCVSNLSTVVVMMGKFLQDEESQMVKCQVAIIGMIKYEFVFSNFINCMYAIPVSFRRRDDIHSIAPGIPAMRREFCFLAGSADKIFATKN